MAVRQAAAARRTVVRFEVPRVAGRACTVDLPRQSVSVIVLERILDKMAPAAADGRGVR